MKGPGSDRVTIANGRVVTPERVLPNGHVTLDGSRVAGVGPGDGDPRGRVVDAAGCLVLPGFVDLHGDDLERHRYPREGASIDVETALATCDRANVAAGITTKFHAVAFEDAPADHRSVDGAREVTRAVSRLEGLLADNRLNARCEIGEDRAVQAVVDVLETEAVGLVSLMNHLPDCGQFEDDAAFERRYTDGGKPASNVARQVSEQRRRVTARSRDEQTRAVVRAARDSGVPVASHDDDDADQLGALSELGVDISEYPVTKPAAARAADLDLVTAMGAPNLVRGGSLWDNLDAGEAIADGLVDVLCTDFHPPSLLASLDVETGEALVDRVARVTAAPADAVGLHDRGRLVPGARADVIVADPGPPPRVRHAFVAGEEVYRAGCPSGRGSMAP